MPFNGFTGLIGFTEGTLGIPVRFFLRCHDIWTLLLSETGPSIKLLNRTPVSKYSFKWPLQFCNVPQPTNKGHCFLFSAERAKRLHLPSYQQRRFTHYRADSRQARADNMAKPVIWSAIEEGLNRRYQLARDQIGRDATLHALST